MAKTVYIAKCPDGSKIKRTTERVYTNAVIAQVSYDTAMERADRDDALDGKNWEFYCQMVAWGGKYGGQRKDYDTDEQIAKDLAKYTALRDRYESREAAIAGERADRVAAVLQARANGYYDQWGLVGFCGRPDLAAKTQAKAAANAYYSNVLTVPAERV